MDPNAVSNSYGRCLRKSNFYDRFYEIFMATDPRIAPMFANTDFKKQKELIKQGVNMTLMFGVGNNPTAEHVIERISKSHSASELNVSPDLYRFWLDSLMKTVAEFDPEFSAELEKAWRLQLAPAIERIKAGYNK